MFVPCSQHYLKCVFFRLQLERLDFFAGRVVRRPRGRLWRREQRSRAKLRARLRESPRPRSRESAAPPDPAQLICRLFFVANFDRCAYVGCTHVYLTCFLASVFVLALLKKLCCGVQQAAWLLSRNVNPNPNFSPDVGRMSSTRFGRNELIVACELMDGGEGRARKMKSRRRKRGPGQPRENVNEGQKGNRHSTENTANDHSYDELNQYSPRGETRPQSGQPEANICPRGYIGETGEARERGSECDHEKAGRATSRGETRPQSGQPEGICPQGYIEEHGASKEYGAPENSEKEMNAHRKEEKIAQGSVESGYSIEKAFMNELATTPRGARLVHNPGNRRLHIRKDIGERGADKEYGAQKENEKCVSSPPGARLVQFEENCNECACHERKTNANNSVKRMCSTEDAISSELAVTSRGARLVHNPGNRRLYIRQDIEEHSAENEENTQKENNECAIFPPGARLVHPSGNRRFIEGNCTACAYHAEKTIANDSVSSPGASLVHSTAGNENGTVEYDDTEPEKRNECVTCFTLPHGASLVQPSGNRRSYSEAVTQFPGEARAFVSCQQIAEREFFAPPAPTVLLRKKLLRGERGGGNGNEAKNNAVPINPLEALLKGEELYGDTLDIAARVILRQYDREDDVILVDTAASVRFDHLRKQSGMSNARFGRFGVPVDPRNENEIDATMFVDTTPQRVQSARQVLFLIHDYTQRFHYYLGVYARETGVLSVYDSMPTSSSQYEWAVRFMSSLLEAFQYPLYNVIFPACALQRDGVNCGVFTVRFLEAILKGESLTLPGFDPRYYRQIMHMLVAPEYERMEAYAAATRVIPPTLRQSSRCLFWRDVSGCGAFLGGS